MQHAESRLSDRLESTRLQQRAHYLRRPLRRQSADYRAWEITEIRLRLMYNNFEALVALEDCGPDYSDGPLSDANRALIANMQLCPSEPSEEFDGWARTNRALQDARARIIMAKDRRPSTLVRKYGYRVTVALVSTIALLDAMLFVVMS